MSFTRFNRKGDIITIITSMYISPPSYIVNTIRIYSKMTRTVVISYTWISIYYTFIKFLISPESQAYWNAETGYFPVTRAADEEQTFKDNVAQYPQFQTAIDQLHDSKPQYAGALLSVFPEARQIVETEIENMINGNETPEKAVESMASQINSSIEDYNLVNE